MATIMSSYWIMVTQEDGYFISFTGYIVQQYGQVVTETRETSTNVPSSTNNLITLLGCYTIYKAGAGKEVCMPIEVRCVRLLLRNSLLPSVIVRMLLQCGLPSHRCSKRFQCSFFHTTVEYKVNNYPAFKAMDITRTFQCKVLFIQQGIQQGTNTGMPEYNGPHLHLSTLKILSR